MARMEPHRSCVKDHHRVNTGLVHKGDTWVVRPSEKRDCKPGQDNTCWHELVANASCTYTSVQCRRGVSSIPNNMWDRRGIGVLSVLRAPAVSSEQPWRFPAFYTIPYVQLCAN